MKIICAAAVLLLAFSTQAQVFTQSWVHTISSHPLGSTSSVPYVDGFGSAYVYSDGNGGAAAVVQQDQAGGQNAYWVLWIDRNGVEIWKSPELTNDFPIIYSLSQSHLFYSRPSTVAANSTTWFFANKTETGVSVSESVKTNYVSGVLNSLRFGSVDQFGFFRYIPRTNVFTRYDFISPPPSVSTVASESGLENGNYYIRWQSAVGLDYQVQRSSNLTNWQNIGSAITGNGSYMAYSEPVTVGTNVFYRVIQD